MAGISTMRLARTPAASGQSHVTAENLGNVTEGAQTFTDLVNMGSVTIDAGSNYVGFFSCEAQQTSTTGNTQTQVVVAGSTIHATPLENDVRSSTEFRSHGGIFFIQNAGAATSKTIKLQGRSTVTGTATFRNSRISLLKLGANDVLLESLALQSLTNTTTNKTATTVATLSFTPPTSGDYLIITSFLPQLLNSTNVYWGFQLTDGATTTTELGMRPEGGSQEPTVFMWKLAGLSGAQSINLNIRQMGTGATTIGIAEIRMLALRLDRFSAAYITSLAADDTGTQSTYTTSLTQTFTPAAHDHLILAAWMQMGIAGGSNTVSGQFLDDGTTIDEVIAQTSFEPANDGNRQAFSHRIATLAASSRTQSIQRKSAATGSNTVKVGSAIVTLDLS